MTNAEPALDYVTIKHLDSWIAREFDGLDLDAGVYPNRQAMLDLAASDEAWLDRGWWRVYDHVASTKGNPK